MPSTRLLVLLEICVVSFVFWQQGFYVFGVDRDFDESLVQIASEALEASKALFFEYVGDAYREANGHVWV